MMSHRAGCTHPCAVRRTYPQGFVRLDQDILTPLAGKKQLYTYETNDFWMNIKTPASVPSPHPIPSHPIPHHLPATHGILDPPCLNALMAGGVKADIEQLPEAPPLCSLSLKASENYLSLYHTTNPALLAQNGGVTGLVKGDVFVHPSAKVAPTAKVRTVHHRMGSTTELTLSKVSPPVSETPF